MKAAAEQRKAEAEAKAKAEQEARLKYEAELKDRYIYMSSMMVGGFRVDLCV
jgi:hypothetical protein